MDRDFAYLSLALAMILVLWGLAIVIPFGDGRAAPFGVGLAAISFGATIATLVGIYATVLK